MTGRISGPQHGPSGVVAGHGGGPASGWVTAHAALIPAGGLVLDLACGRGRHALWLARQGFAVLAVDRDGAALDALEQSAAAAGLAVSRIDGPLPEADSGTLSAIVPGTIALMQADLEQGGWPPGSLRFQGIVVTNYLHRPHFPYLRAALAPGGVLIYETFAEGNARYGKPSNPDFLLRPGELLTGLAGVGDGPAGGKPRVLAYQHGKVDRPGPAMIQRICLLHPTEEEGDSRSDSATIPLFGG